MYKHNATYSYLWLEIATGSNGFQRLNLTKFLFAATTLAYFWLSNWEFLVFAWPIPIFFCKHFVREAKLQTLSLAFRRTWIKWETARHTPVNSIVIAFATNCMPRQLEIQTLQNVPRGKCKLRANSHVSDLRPTNTRFLEMIIERLFTHLSERLLECFKIVYLFVKCHER